VRKRNRGSGLMLKGRSFRPKWAVYIVVDANLRNISRIGVTLTVAKLSGDVKRQFEAEVRGPICLLTSAPCVHGLVYVILGRSSRSVPSLLLGRYEPWRLPARLAARSPWQDGLPRRAGIGPTESMRSYTIILTPTPGGYEAYCPGLPECRASGQGRQVAYRALKSVLRRYLRDCFQRDGAWPLDRTIVKFCRLDPRWLQQDETLR
jgi:predicted RNase H-like HicB family nuclease